IMRAKRGSLGVLGKVLNRVHRAQTGHNGESEEGDKWIGVPLRKGSILDVGSRSVTDPFELNVTCFLMRWCWSDDEWSHVSHVNSPTRRNPINTTQREVL